MPAATVRMSVGLLSLHANIFSPLMPRVWNAHTRHTVLLALIDDGDSPDATRILILEDNVGEGG